MNAEDARNAKAEMSWPDIRIEKDDTPPKPLNMTLSHTSSSLLSLNRPKVVADDIFNCKFIFIF